MSIMRWDPFEDVNTLRRSMERVFDELLPARRTPRTAADTLPWEPAVEMFETPDSVVVRAELPNVDPKAVEVTVTNDTITLQGEAKREQEQKARNYYRRELRYGAFTRTLPLIAEVRSADAKATYKDGILEVTVPKSERARPTAVKVQVNG